MICDKPQKMILVGFCKNKTEKTEEANRTGRRAENHADHMSSWVSTHFAAFVSINLEVSVPEFV